MLDDVTYSLAKALLERRYAAALDLLALIDVADRERRAWVDRLRREINDARADAHIRRDGQPSPRPEAQAS